MNFLNKFAEKLNMDIIYRRIMPSVLCMCISLMCLAGSTWAWFTVSVSTGTQSIQAANFRVSVKVERLDGEQQSQTELQPVNMEDIPSPQLSEMGISPMALDLQDENPSSELSSVPSESPLPSPSVEPSPSTEPEPSVEPSPSPEISTEPSANPDALSTPENTDEIEIPSPEIYPSVSPEGDLMQMDIGDEGAEPSDEPEESNVFEIEQGENGIFAAELEPGNYRFTVIKEGNAKNGYCILEINGVARYIVFSEDVKEITFEDEFIAVVKDRKAAPNFVLATNWGILPEEIPEESIIISGTKVNTIIEENLGQEETPAPSESPEVSPSPSVEPSVSPSPSPEVSTEPSASPEVSPSVSPSPSIEPESSFEPSPSPEVSVEPSESPEASPSVSPSPSVEPEPSFEPSPSPEASIEPSESPKASTEPSVEQSKTTTETLESSLQGEEEETQGTIETPAP